MVGVLVAASLAVILNKPTRLGLDLKGGVELVYQAEPTGTSTVVTGDQIETAIDITRRRIDEFGVSEPEVSRVGEKQISIALPDVANQQRAADQVGTTAQLYMYDWEPNLLGIEKKVGGKPGTIPTKQKLALAKLWDRAGRPSNKPLNSQLIKNGALPRAYEAVKLAHEQPPDEDCVKNGCSVTYPRYYYFSNNDKHRLISGPEKNPKNLKVSPEGKSLPQDGEVISVPPGTVVVSEQPQDLNSGKTVDDYDPGWYALKDRPALSGSEIKDPQQNFDQSNAPIVSFNFTDSGRDAFQEVTRTIAQRGAAQSLPGITPDQAAALSGHFAVVLDNAVETRPIINFQENPDGIDGRQGAQISGGFNSIGEAQDLATILQIGALPINLRLVSSTQVSATLGQQSLDEGKTAGIVGLIAVIIFLIVFYRFLGLIATTALIAYGIIFFALVKLIPITLTLPGIAGLILTIGVAADSNIVIFERIKEEVRKGRSMSSAISAGYRQGIGTIIDANVVTLLTAFILFVLATAGVKGFAFTLAVGTLTSLLTAVVFTQALLGTMSRSRLLRSPSALGAGGKGHEWKFDFMGASRWFFSVSGVILLIGAFALATKQLNFGIDFESGTRITVAVDKQTNEEGVRSALNDAGVDVEEVQAVTDNRFEGDNKAYVFQIQSPTLSQKELNEAKSALSNDFSIHTDATNGDQVFDSTTVGPTFGAQIARSAIRALILSLLVITAYVAFRFQPKFAIPVLIAIFHDILITGGVYSLTGREVSSGTVAAFLTILGYSLYDTIIVFDRIRENLPRMPRAAFSQIVNRSMSEVLTRSLVTSLSTLFGVASLLIFGGTTLQDFAFAMLVGIASGTYSSIFIASPVLTAWKEREPIYASRRAKLAEAHGGVVPPYAEEADVARLDDGPGGDGEKPSHDAEVLAKHDHETEAIADLAMEEEVLPAEDEVIPADEAASAREAAPAGEGTVAPATTPGGLSSEERAERRERRKRARDQRRRKHGRNR